MQNMSLLKSGWIVLKRSVNKIKLNLFTDYKNNKNKWWPLCCKKKKKSTRNIWKYTLRDLALNLIFTAFFFFFICFSWNHERGNGGRWWKNSSIHWNFSSEVMKKRKLCSWNKVELFKNICYYKRQMDRLVSINLTFSCFRNVFTEQWNYRYSIPIYYF